MSNDFLLKIEHLNKTYLDQANANNVLNDINLEIRKKEFLCILGPSGCGKTTLLRCLAGFEQFEGKILVNGESKTVPGTDRIMVFQDFNQLFPWKTIKENIKFPLKLKGIKSRDTLEDLAKEALNKVKLFEYADYYPHQLSGGMKQRVAIAKALALKPEIILMDEPFAALDAMTRRTLQDELLTLSEAEDCTFIFITHNIQEAICLGKRIIVFGKKGDILVDEPNPLNRPITPATEGYGKLWDKLNSALHA